MNKLIAYFSAVIAAAMMLSGCSSSDTDTVTAIDFPTCFAYVQDLNAGTNAAYTNVSYSLRLNYTQMTAEVKINGLRLPDNTSYPTVTLSNVPWTIDKNGFTIVSGKNVAGSTSAGAPAPVFSSFNLTMYDRRVNGMYSPGFSLKYNINSRYAVVSSTSSQVMFGRTTTTGASSAYSTTQTYYSVNMDFAKDPRSVTVVMRNARFADDMKPMNITLENIPFVFDGQTVRWTAENVIPKIDGEDKAGFPITGLSGSIEFGTRMDMSFDCDPSIVSGTFHVVANCPMNFRETTSD